MLSILHYDPKWLEYGFVDELFLQEQVTQYDEANDKNTEHYRYAAFRKTIEAPTIDDVTLDRYVELAGLDEDQAMAHAALALLARHKGLTEAQLTRMKRHRAFAPPELQNIIEQTQLSRELDSSDLTDDLFARCVSFGKDNVQRKLLGKSGISPEQLAVLIYHGANRAIRNLAKEKLRRLV